MERHDRAHGGFLETIEDLLARGQAVRFCANGWSMHPAIRDGELITVEPIGDSRFKTGDVLLYCVGERLIAHRLIDVPSPGSDDQRLVLRGDAADCDDAPVEIRHILGRVIPLDRRGRRTRSGFFRNNTARLAGFVLRRMRMARAKASDFIFVRTI